MKVVNLETIIATLLWYKIWQLNGFNHISAKPKLLRKRKRACTSSWSRRKSQKSFTLTSPWNLAKLVKTYPGIILRRHLIGQRQMVLLRERRAELKTGLLQYCCNPAWRNIGGRIAWSVTATCETYKDLLSDGKTPHERRFGEPFKGPIIPFGSMVEYRTTSATDLSRLHQFGKKVLPGIFLGYVLYAGGIWKGNILVADRNWKGWTHQKSTLGGSMQSK